MKLTKLSIAAAVLLSSSAFAAQPGFFAGVNAGYGDTHYPSIPAPFSTKTTGIAYGLNGGYNFTNYFGVEANANRDANVKIKAAGQTLATYKYYDADLLANGYLNVADNFDLVGKAGMAYVKTSKYTQVSKNSFYRPKAVVGVMYTLADDNVSVSATYSRIFKQGNVASVKYVPNVDVAAISVDYLF